MQDNGISIEEIVKDIKKRGLGNEELMEKYKLDQNELILLLGKLAIEKKIAFSRLTSPVKQHLENGNINQAKEILGLIQRHFPKTSGVKTLEQRLDLAIAKAKCEKEYHARLQDPSVTLQWFNSAYSDVALHPEIERMIRVTDIYSSEENFSVPSRYKEVMDIKKRVQVIADTYHPIANLTKYEANRLWHYVTLIVLSENGIDNFCIASLADPMICDVCMRISFAHFPVGEIRKRIEERIDSGKTIPIRLFPEIRDIDNISPEEKVRVLVENDWSLPPYCDECRCQIKPLF